MARTVRALTALAAIALSYAACGGSTLPSTEPLGGEEIWPDAGTDADAEAGEAGQPPASEAGPVLRTPLPSPPAVEDAGKEASSDAATEASTKDAGPAREAGAVTKKTCDDSKGKPGDCSQLSKPPGNPCFVIEGAKLLCKQLKLQFKPAVAEKGIACLLQNSGSEAICQADELKKCGLEAIQASCPQPKLKQVCADIISSCPAPQGDEKEIWTQEICEQGLAALKDSNRDKMIPCIKSKCKVGDCLGELIGG